jgi:SOS response regulatory protein OraA/RecX
MKSTIYYKKIYSLLMYYLSKRDYSENEMLQKLKIKYPLNDHVESLYSVIEYAKNHNLFLSSQEMSEKHYENLNRKLKGRNYIQSYLVKQNLPAVFIDDELEMQKAKEWIEKQLRRSKKWTPEKLIQSLVNRGFTTSVAIQCVKNKLLKDPI